MGGQDTMSDPVIIWLHSSPRFYSAGLREEGGQQGGREDEKVKVDR